MSRAVKRPVVLVPYREDWPRLFEQEKVRIESAVRPDILDVQHVGSTAIPGMPAKPIIDVAVAVRSFEEAACCIEPLQLVGYVYRGENGIPRRHYFVRGEPRFCHLHMLEAGSEQWRGLLTFRDTLRRSPRLARDYRDLKVHLAARLADDRGAYQDGKAPFIRSVLDDGVLQSERD